MTARRVRLASLLLLCLLLADTLLAACSGGSTVRRTREDAWLLLMAGSYQLTGELPTVAMRGAPRVARPAERSLRQQGPTTPNEAWKLIDYYMGLKESFEQKAKAEGLPPEVIQAGLAEYDAKVKGLVDRAQELEARRARRRGTVWKRFFDGVGRVIGGVFDIGGKIVKFAVEDVPKGVGEYAPDVIKALAQEYVRKLRGELRTKGEQKAFELLAEKSPNLAGAYLLFKAGREGIKALRDFARLFGRHRRGPRAGDEAATQAPVAGEDGDGAFALPSSGAWTGACDSGRDDAVEAWCEQNGGELTHEPVYTLTIDYGAGTFTFTGNTICVGPKATDSFGSWSQVTTTQELHGGGKLYPDGWLVGMVDVSSLWLERGVRVKIGGSESYEEGGPTTGTVPLTAYIDGDEDLEALDVFFTSGAYGEAEALDPDWLRSIGWDGVVDWLRGCEACYTVCRSGGGS